MHLLLQGKGERSARLHHLRKTPHYDFATRHFPAFTLILCLKPFKIGNNNNSTLKINFDCQYKDGSFSYFRE